MPRAATSVATQTRARPSRMACRAWVRSVCDSSPDSATTEKPRLRQARGQPVHHRAGVAEHDGIGRLVVAQHVDDGVLRVRRGDRQGAVVDIGMLRWCRLVVAIRTASLW